MASPNYDILQFLSEYRTESISQSFEELLTNSINIREGIRSIASTSQQNLREFLQSESDRDASFPRVLRTADRDFLSGSFARHTKNRPLDDIDIYVPLDGGGLFYYEHGVIAPYSVLTDGVSLNPLLTSRWTTGSYVSSAKVIAEFAAVLKHRFSQTEITTAGQAVSVSMTYGQTLSNDGLGYDVVPCFALRPNQEGEGPFYLIADGNAGWIRTNPKADAIIADLMQDKHNKLFRKAVKLVKYWNAEFLNDALGSYFIELSIARAFCEKAAGTIAPLSYGVALGFRAVQQAAAKGSLESWVPKAPPVLPGPLQISERLLLTADMNLACAAWEDEKAGRNLGAAKKWSNVFGGRFPS